VEEYNESNLRNRLVFSVGCLFPKASQNNPKKHCSCFNYLF